MARSPLNATPATRRHHRPRQRRHAMRAAIRVARAQLNNDSDIWLPCNAGLCCGAAPKCPGHTLAGNADDTAVATAEATSADALPCTPRHVTSPVHHQPVAMQRQTTAQQRQQRRHRSCGPRWEHWESVAWQPHRRVDARNRQHNCVLLYKVIGGTYEGNDVTSITPRRRRSQASTHRMVPGSTDTRARRCR